MENPRHHFLAFTLLALLLVAASFTAGYLLMTPNTPPAPPAASAPAPPATGPHLVIKTAFYGDLPDGPSTDVTVKVAAAVVHDSLSIAASNDNFGDPAEGIVKKLRVEYLLDGTPHSRTVQENETLVIRSVAPQLVIQKALYGDLPDGPSTDVTAKVAQTASDDSLSIAASNDLFGDPAPGIVKKLRVDFTLAGKPLSKTVSENETLTIPPAGQ